MTETPQLLADTSIEAIGFADSLIDDGLWTAGRGRVRAARFDRVRELVAFGEALRVHRCRRERAGLDLSAVDAVLSEVALDLSALAREAEADRTLRPAHFDTWALCHAADADVHAREETASHAVPLPATGA